MFGREVEEGGRRKGEEKAASLTLE